MASALPFRDLRLRFEARLNPCRDCGEAAGIERNQSDWAWEERFRATCPAVHDPIYLGGAVYRQVTDGAEAYLRQLLAALDLLVELWNDRHDGPGFIAGLA